MAQLLTIIEAAEVLRVGHKSIRAAIKAGKLTASKVGGDWRIATDHLNEFLAAKSNNAKRAIYSVDRAA